MSIDRCDRYVHKIGSCICAYYCVFRQKLKNFRIILICMSWEYGIEWDGSVYKPSVLTIRHRHDTAHARRPENVSLCFCCRSYTFICRNIAFYTHTHRKFSLLESSTGKLCVLWQYFHRRSYHMRDTSVYNNVNVYEVNTIGIIFLSAASRDNKNYHQTKQLSIEYQIHCCRILSLFLFAMSLYVLIAI